MRRDTEAATEGAVGELEATLAALGRMLDRRGFATAGLCLLEVDGGYVATGLRVPDRGAAYSLAQETLEVGSAELAALIEARLRPPR
jgi:hypothetical protein